MLTFDETKHQYKFDGVVIPSVTQVIKDAGLVNLDWISKELLEAKADLGTKVHTTTELYDAGVLNMDELHPTLKSYLDSWIKFRQDYDFTPIEIELEGFHPIYRYAGRIDRIGSMKKCPLVLADIKSGTVQKTHAIQTAGYEELYNYGKKRSEQIKKRLAVYLSPEGYKVKEYNSQTDKSVFLSCLTISNYKRSA